MDPRVARYATSAVPRYTSYPAVPHWAPELPAATVCGWLERLDPTVPVSLYLHVPFCRELCWYCGCNMRLATRYGPVADYVETLLAEVALVADRLPGRMRVEHLHFGGGTPTSLSPDDLARVMGDLHERFEFLPDAEIAIESDPRTLTDTMIARIGELGFTRASFGVQEFSPRVQRAINRIQSPDMVRHAIDGLRDVGVTGINVDLIYGLPHQTVASLTSTVESCITMAPDRLALFGYAHVPWMAKKQKLIEESALPDTAERAAQAEAAAATLVTGGYDAIGLDHFALPTDDLAVAAREGRLHRNFQGYTVDAADTLIGLGTTSIGRTPEGFVQNLSGAGPWARAIERGELPVARGHRLTADDRLRAEAIERLMCDGRVDTNAVGARHGVSDDWCAEALAELEPLVDDGLVTIDAGIVALTELGQPLLRVVAAAFDAYRAHTPARHSVAV